MDNITTKPIAAKFKMRASILFLWLQGITGITIWLFLFYQFIKTDGLYKNAWDSTSFIIHGITFSFMAITGMYILIWSRKSTPSIYYALFILVWANTEGLHFVNDTNAFATAAQYLYNIEYALLFVTGIKLAQEFPYHLDTKNIARVYHRTKGGRLIMRPLIWMLQKNRTWILILPVSLVLTFTADRLYVKLYSVLLICLFLAYIWGQHLYINIKKAMLLYWVIWAAVCQLFVSLFYFLVLLYGVNNLNYIEDVLNIVGCLSAMVATAMVVYFSDLLDSGLILRKTLLYGVLFFIITIIFGAFEHFVIHNLSHWLRLNDVYVISIFSGILGMGIHPLKEKIEHGIKHFDKKHKAAMKMYQPV